MFVVLEGIDGSGTTTQAQRLVERLGSKASFTAEPSTGPVGTLIRELIRQPTPPPWHVLALLFAADRAHHVEAVIQPELAFGKIVVCDRYHLSTICYQLATACESYGRSEWSIMLHHAQRFWITDLAHYCLVPDLTIVLQVDAEVGLERLRERAQLKGQPLDYYEREAERLERIAHLYSKAPTLLKGQCVEMVDGSQSIEAVAEQIWKLVSVEHPPAAPASPPLTPVGTCLTCGSEPPKVDRTQRTTLHGTPIGEHLEIGPDGMQKDYVVLTAAERAKGFVRPVRRSYRHLGYPGPQYPLRDLTAEEQARYPDVAYVKFEQYEDGTGTGRFWTQKDLDGASRGCGSVTTMGVALAETYARDPSFYSGTFCASCSKHFPVGQRGEFVWEGTDERVGT